MDPMASNEHTAEELVLVLRNRLHCSLYLQLVNLVGQHGSLALENRGHAGSWSLDKLHLTTSYHFNTQGS